MIWADYIYYDNCEQQNRSELQECTLIKPSMKSFLQKVMMVVLHHQTLES